MAAALDIGSPGLGYSRHGAGAVGRRIEAQTAHGGEACGLGRASLLANALFANALFANAWPQLHGTVEGVPTGQENTVKLMKVVPLTLATARYVALIDPAASPSSSPFLKMWAEKLSRRWYLPMSEARALQSELVDLTAGDPFGLAYASGLTDAIGRSEDDAWRSFDQLDPTDDPTTLDALSQLVDDLEQRSPLLEPLADALNLYSPWLGMTLEAAAAVKARITEHAVGIGALLEDDDPVAPSAWIAWADIELLAPGTHLRAVELLGALYGDIPHVDDDAGVRCARDEQSPEVTAAG
jgi:hypothetical protein